MLMPAIAENSNLNKLSSQKKMTEHEARLLLAEAQVPNLVVESIFS
jgi:hypothetical protein